MRDNRKLPDPRTDTAAWYQEAVAGAELAEHAAVKGCMVIRPYGFAIWELIRDELDRRIKQRGVQNAYFPLFIPQSFLAREKEHVEGFSPECAVVTHAGGRELEEPLIVRPTSETIIHDSMKRWIRSYRDLPLRLNQWANVVRWEKRPRLFLRNTEFLWQEGHTAHATAAEARAEVAEMIRVYAEFVSNVLAIPAICGLKSDQEKFAGAVESSSIEGLMIDGKGLQMGTVHYLGDNFSRMTNIQYLDATGQREFVHMTSWGVSTRLIGALLLTHGDAKGIVLPPLVAPIQVVLIPIGVEKGATEVRVEAEHVAEVLRSYGLRVHVDDRDTMSPGAKYYHWELRGVPLRVEIGPRDVSTGSVTIVWRTGTMSKQCLNATDLSRIPALIDTYQGELLSSAAASLRARIFAVSDHREFLERLRVQDGFIRASWCGNPSCERAVKDQTSATIRNIPPDEQREPGPCIWCGSAGKHIVYFAKAY